MLPNRGSSNSLIIPNTQSIFKFLCWKMSFCSVNQDPNTYCICCYVPLKFFSSRTVVPSSHFASIHWFVVEETRSCVLKRLTRSAYVYLLLCSGIWPIPLSYFVWTESQMERLVRILDLFFFWRLFPRWCHVLCIVSFQETPSLGWQLDSFIIMLSIHLSLMLLISKDNQC